MTIFFLAVLILLDAGLLVAVFYLNRRQEAQVELVAELTEERRLLSELRTSVQEELEGAQGKARDVLDRVSHMAAEAEMEVKSGGATLAREMESVASSISARFESPMRDLAKKQVAIEAMLKRVDQQKLLLQKLVARGEKICRFFDDRVPYEEVLEEISDKKYSDARAMLAKGNSPTSVAQELGMSESEVRVLAGLALR